MTQLAIFDYSSLAPDVREFLILKEKTIKLRMMNSVIDTGRDLIEAKDRCDFGTFVPWVNYAFGMSKERAAEYMRVAREFEGIDSDLLDQFGKSALVMLSSKSMPVQVREKALELAESGEKVSVDVVKKLRQEMDLLRYENVQLRNKAPEVEIVEKVVEKEVIPPDYEDVKKQNENFRSQAESALQSADELRKRLDKERMALEKAEKEKSVIEAVTNLREGIRLIGQCVGLEMDSYDIPLYVQQGVVTTFEFLAPMIQVSHGIEMTNTSSRNKLLRAGFTLIRPDEASLTIKQYDFYGVWRHHSKYDNRRSFRDALKSLNDDEKVILA